MKASHTFLDHTADILFEAQASTLGQLFEQCGLALEETQVELSHIKPNIEKIFHSENKDVEALLYDFLDDLLFYKDAEQLIFCTFTIDIKKIGELYQMSCFAKGDLLNDSHEQKVDVKAITMHLFEVKEIKGGWKAKVLVDI